MKKLSDFLERFSKLAKKSDDTLQAIIDALTEAGIRNVEMKNITLKGNIIRLNVSPVQKSELFLKQQKILDKLAKNPLTESFTRVC